MSTYAFLSNNLKQTLVYYPIPKNANTSAKYFIIKHCGLENQFNVPIDTNNRLQKEVNNRRSIASFIPSKQKFGKVNANFKACILREPIKRFISAYTNRVMYRKDPGFFDHTVDMVIEKLENLQFDNKHFLPQTYFIGKNLSYFDIVCCTNTLGIFTKAVNSFFRREIKFPSVKSNSSHLKLNLSNKQIDKLIKVYEDDLILYEKYKKIK